MDYLALNMTLWLTLISGSVTPRSGVQRSGIEGRLYAIAGNRMPGPPRRYNDTVRGDNTLQRPATGPGIKGTICVFELTNDRQVTRKGTSPYCEAVHTRLIRQADTDDKGNFRIPLPPGTYSVFIRENGLYYAGRRDEKNNIAPVTVAPGKWTRVDYSVESGRKVYY
ncbi:MAG TPA: carboxypeptidase-like regulatory domain-containing protein [Puia sp.]|nr:carboxypeptidase-like regulatory domain-containing protein [Puia sp.]